jgi:hypothetical protein
MDMDNFDPTARVFFSDHVLREAGTNKLSIIGIFQAWNASHFPFPIPPFIATVSLENLTNLPKKLTLLIRIEQIDTGLVLANAGAMMGFHPDFKMDDVTNSLEVSIPINPFVVNSPGKFVAVVLVNGNEIARKTFSVTSLTQPNPQNPTP